MKEERFTRAELFEQCSKHFEAGELDKADKIMRPLARHTNHSVGLHNKIFDLEEKIVDALIERNKRELNMDDEERHDIPANDWKPRPGTKEVIEGMHQQSETNKEGLTKDEWYYAARVAGWSLGRYCCDAPWSAGIDPTDVGAEKQDHLDLAFPPKNKG